MTKLRNNLFRRKQYIFLALLVAFFAELYFYPFKGEFKFSAGVVVLNLIILSLDDVSEFWIPILSGFAVLAVRSAVLILAGSNLNAALAINYPSLLYYLTYACLSKTLDIRRKKNYIFLSVLLLTLVDVSGNLLEALARYNINVDSVRLIVAVGALRSIFAYFVYELYQRQKLFILNEEHQKRYTQLNMLISNIQAEMFYLKKSMKDIENVMKKSYSLYEKDDLDGKSKELALNIARDVHEIKKDYYRVILGFEDFVKSLENDDSMKISSIITIIRDNIQRFLKAKNKNINISMHYEKDFCIRPFYSIFTLLNNLLANSVDACKNGDAIALDVREFDEEVYFEVEDSGEGIEEDLLPYIFSPGFTTKYDETTGNSHTGMGLSHVDSIVKELGGRINVNSWPGKGTKFEIYIPKKNLVR